MKTFLKPFEEMPQIEELREQGYKGFYVAIGCQRGRKPGITGENAKGTYAAVDFLREAGAKESFALEALGGFCQ